MSEPLLRTPLFSWHQRKGARIVPFGGWEMPVQYSSIVQEHVATRTAAGAFDISHMGRINFVGDGAAAFLDRLLTNSVTALKPGQIRYSLVVDDNGGILDDVLVYRTPAQGHSDHMLVVNASNRQKILDHIQSVRSASDALEVEDRTAAWGMIAVQGPRSLDTVQPLVNGPLDAIKYYHFAGIDTCGSWGIASRTGYTGEDGVELIAPSEKIVELWEAVVQSGAKFDLRPCGLGARDTLRLEAGMPLYGHELDERTDPFMAGLGFAVKLTKGEFIGKRALIAAKRAYDAGLSRRRVGLELEGKRIAREGFVVLKDGAKVGIVSSGTFSPTLAKVIAMAYVQPDVSEPGTQLAVNVRGQTVQARVVKLPFYRRPAVKG
jgi:aminomethyltransferase